MPGGGGRNLLGSIASQAALRGRSSTHENPLARPPNYRQQKRQKELARLARKAEKQQNRRAPGEVAQTATPDGSAAAVKS